MNLFSRTMGFEEAFICRLFHFLLTYLGIVCLFLVAPSRSKCNAGVGTKLSYSSVTHKRHNVVHSLFMVSLGWARCCLCWVHEWIVGILGLWVLFITKLSFGNNECCIKKLVQCSDYAACIAAYWAKRFIDNSAFCTMNLWAFLLVVRKESLLQPLEY